MPKRQDLLFSLTRKRIRASWNKFNLYNLATWRKGVRRGTLYQQKWTAKTETRAYHGEPLTEKRFRNAFTAELNAVAPLQGNRSQQAETPWALQTYVALERRLDVAIFRAMFASSVRQAAQFILQGKAKVNGVRITQPGYELQPGDVFSVDPDSVLYATGREKPSVSKSVEYTNRIIRRYNHYLAACKKNPETMWRRRVANQKRHVTFASRLQRTRAAKISAHNKRVYAEMNAEINSLTPIGVFEGVLKQEQHVRKTGVFPNIFGESAVPKCLSILHMAIPGFGRAKPADTTENVVPAEPVEANKLTEGTETGTESADNAVESEKVADAEASATESVEVSKDIVNAYYPPADYTKDPPSNKGDVKKLVQEVIKIHQEEIRVKHNKRVKDASASNDKYDPEWAARLGDTVPLIEGTPENPSDVGVPLPFGEGKLYGLANPEKPYFTPWAARPFLPPFAILPHHIEVSFKTCHAVYMRDPMARPGASEVISPFSLDMHERAYMFYLKKRRKNL